MASRPLSKLGGHLSDSRHGAVVLPIRWRHEYSTTGARTSSVEGVIRLDPDNSLGRQRPIRVDAFSYLSVLLSIILGLGLTQVLTAVGRVIRHRDRVRVDWLPMLWAGVLLVVYVQVWWS